MDVFDGKDNEYACKIEKIYRGSLELETIETMKGFQNPCQITLACAVVKNSRFDYLIEKAAELGVKRIIPMRTQRTIVKLSQDRKLIKLNRWKIISQEASKQCERIDFPEIEPVGEFKGLLNRIGSYDLAIMPNLGLGNRDIAEAVKDFKGSSILVFIGPEGDFSQEEIDSAVQKGSKGVSLGNLVLKTDTAAIAVLSYLRLNFMGNKL